MKIFKSILLLLVITVGFLFYKSASEKKDTSHYTITADTNVSKVKGLNKYVT